MADLTDSLNRLNATVRAKRSAVQSRKRDDWSRVESEHADHAAFIRAVSGAFGKPSKVRVTSEAGEVLMDSRRYV